MQTEGERLRVGFNRHGLNYFRPFSYELVWQENGRLFYDEIFYASFNNLPGEVTSN